MTDLRASLGSRSFSSGNTNRTNWALAPGETPPAVWHPVLQARTSRQAFFVFVSSALLFVLAGAIVVHAAQKKFAAGSVLVADKGKFKVLLDGKTIGHEEFEISPSGAGWTAKATTHLTPEGSPSATVTGNLSLAPDGAPISYEWTSQADKTNAAHILFVNSVAKMTIQLQGAHPFEQDLTFSSPLIVVLDDNLYYQ